MTINKVTTFFCSINYFFLLPKTVTTEGRIQDPDTNPVVVVVVVVFWTNPNPGRCFERSADVLFYFSKTQLSNSE